MLTYASDMLCYSAMSDRLRKKYLFEMVLQTIPLQMLHDLNSNKVYYYGN